MVNKRLEYLAKQYDVFDEASDIVYDDDSVISKIYDDSGLYSIVVSSPDSSGRKKKKVHISVLLFSMFIKNDPTDNLMCVQWMLRSFVNMVRSGADLYECLRFINEDISMFMEYITIFEANKNKERFKTLCMGNRYLSDVKDIKDINSYSSVSKLFEAVDPFIEKDHSGLRGMIDRYVSSGQAMIPYSDGEYMVYVPLTVSASEILSSFASWCTAAKGNGMFRTYTGSNLRGDGSPSLLYVIIPKVFFDGFTDMIYQVHFETNQFMTRGNQYISYDSACGIGDGVRGFLSSELLSCMRIGGSGKYWDFVNRYGFTEVIFDYMDISSKDVVFIRSSIGVIPDNISRLSELEHLVIVGCGLRKISVGISGLKNLKVISINDNPINVLPGSIGDLKSLRYLSMKGCGLRVLPDTLSYLDPSRGGSLGFVACDDVIKDDVRRLLPNVVIL